MAEHLDLNKINRGIADRSNVFYWQTDRSVTPEQAGEIWADRHRYFTDEQLLQDVNAVLDDDKLEGIEPFNPDAQTNLGNVNSSRIGCLVSGQEVVVRSHPRGVKNGYFHVETTAAELAIKHGLPSYKTFAVHDMDSNDDFSFQVIEKLPGSAMKKWLETRPEDEQRLLFAVGQMMAMVHQIPVAGFGPFDNERAKASELQGLHKQYVSAVCAGLNNNLAYLVEQEIFTDEQVKAVNGLFIASNPLLQCDSPVLVHNDFADWNLLTDGQDITGILDWDECVGGDPVSDIACWSTFFDPERLSGMLEGYFSIADKPENFDEKFELLRLRYTVSKMTLRLRRYNWEKSDFILSNIEKGKKHLEASLKYFEIR